MAEMKKNKNNKDHMIEEIYGRMFVMDKRVESLSKDNEGLMEENRLLLCKIKQLEKTKQMMMERNKDSLKIEEEIKKLKTKPKKKDILLSVTEEDINEAFNIKKVEHDIDEE